MQLMHQKQKQRIDSQRRFAVWVCALSLLLQGLLPIIAVSAKAATDVPQTSALAGFNYICTAYGIQSIEQLEASESGQANDINQVSGSFCPLCQIHNLDLAITPPTLPSVSGFQTVEELNIPVYLDVNLKGHFNRPIHPRAPPARS